MNSPSFLAIGHVTWDVLPDDLEAKEPGGAVAFASITASRLGLQPAIVTSSADDYPIREVIDAPERSIRVPSLHTSTFENRYDARGDRLQILHRRAGEISEGDVPPAWRNPDLLFVGPLTQELPYDCLRWFHPRVSCVVPQGWLRSWRTPLPSMIRVSKSPPASISRGWDICVLSESEIETKTLNDWRDVARHLVVTKGREGADLYSEDRSKPFRISTHSHRVDGAGNDTTGAGDVFAAAMVIRFGSTGDARSSAEFASLCAALSTRAPSWSAVEKPKPEMLESPTG